ncbi:hypothetical protein JCM17960_04040 [Magnetospira thiophila]
MGNVQSTQRLTQEAIEEGIVQQGETVVEHSGIASEPVGSVDGLAETETETQGFTPTQQADARDLNLNQDSNVSEPREPTEQPDVELAAAQVAVEQPQTPQQEGPVEEQQPVTEESNNLEASATSEPTTTPAATNEEPLTEPVVEPTVVDGTPEATAASVSIDEADLGSVTGDLNIDFGSDGGGSVELIVAQDLINMGLTSNGDPLAYTLSADGSMLTANTEDGRDVFTVELSNIGGVYSYTFNLLDNLDHADGAGANLLDLPLQIAVTDADGDRVTTDFQISIEDALPEAVNDAAVTVSEGADAVGGNVLDNDNLGADGGQVLSFTYTGPDGEQLTADAGSTVITENGGNLTVNEDGTWTYEPPADADHTASDSLSEGFTYTVQDNDGDITEATQEINLVDTAPTAVDDATQTLEEGGNTISGNILDNDVNGGDGISVMAIAYTDENGELQSAQVGDNGVTVDTQYGELTVNADGSWSYESDAAETHDGGEPLSDGFTYTVTDGDGDTATATQGIEITDTGPTAVADTDSVIEGQSVSGTVLGGAGDDTFGADGAAANPVTAGTFTGDYGTLELNADGSYTYTANDGLDHSGGDLTDTFTYEITDADGTTSSSTLTLTVGDEGITANAADATVDETGGLDSVTGDLGIVAGTDGIASIELSADGATWDADSNTLTADDGTYQVVVNDDGTYTFTQLDQIAHPDGTDANDAVNLDFTVTATDGDGDVVSDSFTVQVLDDGPVVLDDGTVQMDEGGVVATGNVLGNDDLGLDGGTLTSFSYTDENGDTQTAEAGSTVDTQYGELTVNADGSWSYESDAAETHDGGAPLSDGFTYTVTDGDGDTATATQGIEITDTGPTAVADTDSVIEGQSVSGTVLGGAGDDTFGADGAAANPVTAGTFTGDYGTLELNADGSYTYTANDGLDHSGGDLTDTFTYEITDADGTTSSSTLTLTVGDEGITANAADATVDETGGLDSVTGDLGIVAGTDGIASIELSADGATWDADSNTLTADDGTYQVVVNDDGTYTFTQLDQIAHPDGTDANDAVNLDFTVTATDGDGDVVSDSFTVQVLDDGPVAVDDVDTVASRVGSTTSGNVLLGTDVEGSDGANIQADSLSQDGTNVVTQVTFGDQTISFDDHAQTDDSGARFVQVDGDGGSLVMYENGDYTYTVTETSTEGSAFSLGGHDVARADYDVNTLWNQEIDGHQISVTPLKADGSEGDYGFEYQGDVVRGIGVAGGGDAEIDGNEAMRVDFDGMNVNDLTIGVRALFAEGQVADGVETGQWTAYRDGVEVGSGTFDADGSASDGRLAFTASVDGGFDQIVFSGAEAGADFHLEYIEGETPGTAIGADQFEYTIRDADGDTSTATLTIDPSEVPDLFTSGNDTVDFGEILPGSYSMESYNDALGGDDIITLADDMSAFGFDGDDYFDAGAGDDQIIGGAGDDLIDGGADFDTAVLSGNFDDYTITLNDDGSYTVIDDRGTDGEDTFVNVENFSFADGDVAAGDLVDPNTGPVATDDSGTDGSGATLVSEDFNSGSSDWGGDVSFVEGKMDIAMDETASKTFDFGSDHANQTVVIEFDMTAEGTWDASGYLQDFFNITANGSEIAHDTMGPGSSHYSFEVQTDANGQVVLELNADTTGSDEHVLIDNFTITGGEDWSTEITTTEDTTLTIQADALLGNDTDADGDALSIISVQDATDGTVTLNDDGTVSFTPDENFSGETTFTYTISDGQGGTDTATVTLNVDAEADTPTLTVADASGDEDTAIALDIGAALGDTDGSETLVVTIDGVPDGASLSAGTENDDGTWTLTADDLNGLTITPADDSGADFDLTVTATAMEGNGDIATTTSTLSVTVNDVADAPTLTVSLGDAQVTTDGSGSDGSGGGKGHGGSGGGKGHGGSDGSGGGKGHGGSDGSGGGKWHGGSDGSGGGKGHGGSDGSGGGKGHGGSDGSGGGKWHGGSDGSGGGKGKGGSDGSSGGKGKGGSGGSGGGKGHGGSSGGKGHGGSSGGDGAGDGGSSSVVIPLNLMAGLGDLDGSESLTITIDGVPDGVELSAGTDNQDGTWTLTESDLDDLSMSFSSDDVSSDFSLTISATATEADGGDTSTVVSEISVPVEDILADTVSDTDTLVGSTGDDSLVGGSSEDFISAGDGGDMIDAGSGDDILQGGAGDDTLMGGDGDDSLFDGSGDDVMMGGAGDDLFTWGGGQDTADGGSGWTDSVHMDSSTFGDAGDGWTLVVDGQDMTQDAINANNNGQSTLDIGDDASGYIVTEDGDRLDFDNMEHITWG